MQRPGGRTEAIRKAVAATVLDLLAAGKTEFTVLEVAERSGVGRRTIHRRWPNRLALLREALAEHHQTLKVTFCGDFAEDLYRLAAAFREFSMDPHEMAINRLLATTDEAAFREEVDADFAARVTESALERFRQAQAAGDFSREVEPRIAWMMLSSTLFTLCFMARSPPDDGELRVLVDAMLRMCRP
jgi:AcrR family transcriptional regulator